ncbi:MAG: two-component system NtrC family response regulator, partial [Motiliproteus sp.]
DRYARAQGRQLRGFTDQACQAIAAFKWPGNIRELENRVKRAVIMADGPQVTDMDLGLATSDTPEEMPLNLKQARDEAERRVVLMALGQTENNISKASELLGITRPTLYALIEKLSLVVGEPQRHTL